MYIWIYLFIYSDFDFTQQNNYQFSNFMWLNILKKDANFKYTQAWVW